MNYNLDDLRHYKQKSMMFLYPLLQLPSNITPDESYLRFNSTKGRDEKLLILQFNKHEVLNHDSMMQYISKHELFEFILKDDASDYVVFNMEPVKDEYRNIINGLYSKLDKTTKMKYFNGTEMSDYVYIALNPAEHFDQYSKHFNAPEEYFGPDTELVSPPDIQKETLQLSEGLLKKLDVIYDLA